MVRQPYDSGNESDAYNGDLHTTQVLTTSTSSHQGTMDLHNDPLDGFEGLTVPDALRSSTTSKKSRTPRSTANAKVGQSKISNMDQEDSDSDGSVDPNSAESKLYSKQIQAVNRKKNKSGGFQSMGLMANVLRAVLNKGYKVPTPIQRKCIPLVLEGKDVVGMARTGSGKTAAFTIPLVNRLRNHSAKVGVRGLILSPSRELALQTLKFAKELSKYTDLRHCALVGGDRLEEQYEMMAANPDILVATPGRCLHLIVEMNLDLSSVEYVVFDEADRLFEMGFSVQLHEILHRLPPSRQTLLFSATLPNNLVDFAKAGLHEPELVRLDVDTKISSDLEMAFFQVKPLEKEGALLYLLRNVIQLPTMTSEERVLEARRVALLREQTKVARESRRRNKKGKGKPGSREDSNDQDDDLDDQELEEANPANHVGTDQQTIIFVATKHHVEYLSQLLIEAGFKVSYIYGSLDQTARKIQTHNFRMGYSHIMVVTDVAARGIDIPILQNVVNYHFVDSSKTFIHRVGRVARAGRRGWAYSLVTNEELPHVLDLQLFLGRQLVVGKTTKPVHQIDYTKDIVLGRLPHELFDTDLEWVQGQLQVIVTLYDNHRMSTNGLKLFNKTKRVASSESYKRTKDLLLDPDLQEAAHPLIAAQIDDAEKKRLAMVHAISNFRPSETIFEVGQRGTKHISAATEVMRKRRVTSTKYIEEVRQKQAERESLYQEKLASGVYDSDGESDNESPAAVLTSDAETADPSSSVQVLDGGQSGKYRDEGYYISYYQKDANTERGYAVNKGMTFAEQAQSAVFGIQGDENVDLIKQKNALRWDKKKKQFTRGFGVGADNKKMIRSESGALLPASYASGSFTEWQNKTHIQIPRTGEAELSNFRGMPARRRFPHASAGQSGKKGNGAGKGKGKGKGDLKTTDQIVKQRRLESKRKERMTQRTNNKRKKTK